MHVDCMKVTQSLGEEKVRGFAYADDDDDHARHVQQQLIQHHSLCWPPLLVCAEPTRPAAANMLQGALTGGSGLRVFTKKSLGVAGMPCSATRFCMSAVHVKPSLLHLTLGVWTRS